MERAKPQAATKLVSQAGKNVSRKTRKPAQLQAFSFQNYQYLATKLVRLSNSFRDVQDSPCHQFRPVESMFSTAGNMLNSTKSSKTPYKVDMVLFIHDDHDVVCLPLTSTADQQFLNLLFN